MNKLELMKMANEVRKGALTGVFHAKAGWQKGGKNPAHSEECRSGRRSPWSMKRR